MPSIVTAVLSGVAVLLGGSVAWSLVLAPLNLRLLPAIPWAVLPMTAYLIVYWRFISGRIGDVTTASSRRARLRAHPVSPDVWIMTLLAGLLGFGALLAFLSVMARLVIMPPSAPIVLPPDMPQATAVILLVMASVVAGVTEEAAFRGYMQTPIEQRYGLMPAILVNGTMFGLLHFANHPQQVLTMLPYYIAVAAVYGGMTWAANSIWPSLVLHAVGDIWSLTRLWATGRAEWQITQPAPSVWENGVDRPLMVAAAAVVVLSLATVATCRAAARQRAVAPMEMEASL